MLWTAGTERVIFATLESAVYYLHTTTDAQGAEHWICFTHIQWNYCLERLHNLLLRSLSNTTSNHETDHGTDEKAAATIGGASGHTEAVRRQTLASECEISILQVFWIGLHSIRGVSDSSIPEMRKGVFAQPPAAEIWMDCGNVMLAALNLSLLQYLMLKYYGNFTYITPIVPL